MTYSTQRGMWHQWLSAASALLVGVLVGQNTQHLALFGRPTSTHTTVQQGKPQNTLVAVAHGQLQQSVGDRSSVGGADQSFTASILCIACALAQPALMKTSASRLPLTLASPHNVESRRVSGFCTVREVICRKVLCMMVDSASLPLAAAL